MSGHPAGSCLNRWETDLVLDLPVDNVAGEESFLILTDTLKTWNMKSLVEILSVHFGVVRINLMVHGTKGFVLKCGNSCKLCRVS